MKELYKKFGISVDYEDSIRMFRNKMENIFGHSRIGATIMENEENDVVWEFNNKLGITHRYYSDNLSKTRSMLDRDLSFEEFLFRLQTLFKIIWDYDNENTVELCGILSKMIYELPVDIGVDIKIVKDNAPVIVINRSKNIRKKIIKTLDNLEGDEKNNNILEHYKSALGELFKAKSKAQLKDVVEDLSTVCDSVVKNMFKDENLGFKHLFKDNRWEAANLNRLQKDIYNDLRRLMDKIKHDEIKDYCKKDIEIIMFLTSEFINLMLKNGTT